MLDVVWPSRHLNAWRLAVRVVCAKHFDGSSGRDRLCWRGAKYAQAASRAEASSALAASSMYCELSRNIDLLKAAMQTEFTARAWKEKRPFGVLL